MQKANIDISVVIPAKDESKRLPNFLNKIVEYTQQSSLVYEIIVIDDGSSDNTSEVASAYKSKFTFFKVIQFSKNRGKGQAVQTGLLEAKGEVVAFLDADGATPIEEIEQNLQYFDQGFEIVIGSRVVADNKHTIKAKAYRKWIGRIFNILVHLVLFKNFEDTQCGFKMFKKEVVSPLFSRLNIKGFGFDLEILYLAHKMGYEIKEAPVNWTHVDDSKINLITDSLKMFINIFQIRNWHFTPINMQTKFMSVKEITYMYSLEKHHWWFQSKNELIKNLISKLDRKFKFILDAGCGTGLNLSYLKNFGTCFGCDVVLEALQFCKKNELTNLSQCNLEGICLKDKSFDLVTILDVIEHVDNPEKVLAELRRVLRDDGTLIVSVPAFKFLWSQHDDALNHLRRYEKKELKELLEFCGFEVKKMGYFFFVPFLIVLPIRVIRKLFVKKGESTSDTTTLPPKFLNSLLKWMLKIEAKLAAKFSLPFGTTLFAVLSKANVRVGDLQETTSASHGKENCYSQTDTKN
jgi:dolichyl-phosphate beta-glucosyltransferase